MTLKNTVKFSLITLVSIVTCSVVVTLMVNSLIQPKKSLFYGFIDILFYIDMIVLFVGSIMFIGQSGAYNSISYSSNLVRARVSTKYKHTLMASADIEANEINDHLKQTYLYRTTRYKHTYTILIPAAFLFIALMVYVTLVY